MWNIAYYAIKRWKRERERERERPTDRQTDRQRRGWKDAADSERQNHGGCCRREQTASGCACDVRRLNCIARQVAVDLRARPGPPAARMRRARFAASPSSDIAAPSRLLDARLTTVRAICFPVVSFPPRPTFIAATIWRHGLSDSSRFGAQFVTFWVTEMILYYTEA